MDGSILGDASISLQKMLNAAVKLAFATAQVVLESPKEAEPSGPDEALVSLWLYRVTRQGDLNNRPPRRIAPDRLEAPRLPVELHYLATPLGADTLTRQRLLGIVLQAMHANAILPADRLEAPLVTAGVGALRAHLHMHTIEDMVRIWHALSEPYQPSVAYVVDFVPLPAAVEPLAGPPVLDRNAGYSAIASLVES
jgi:hypothetical protein